MKVHELIQLYKEGLEAQERDWEQIKKNQQHDIAYLQHLDPMTEVNPTIWKDYKPVGPLI